MQCAQVDENGLLTVEANSKDSGKRSWHPSWQSVLDSWTAREGVKVWLGRTLAEASSSSSRSASLAENKFRSRSQRPPARGSFFFLCRMRVPSGFTGGILRQG